MTTVRVTLTLQYHTSYQTSQDPKLIHITALLKKNKVNTVYVVDF